MAKGSAGNRERRIDISYFEGVNALVGDHVSKKQELRHAENMRSKTIGSIEKREGQVVTGTSSTVNSVTAATENINFAVDSNYGLFNFSNNKTGSSTKGLYRVSAKLLNALPMKVNVSDEVHLFDPYDTTQLTIFIKDNLAVTESVNNIPATPLGKVDIFALTTADKWTSIASNITPGQFETVAAEDCLFMSNYNDYNMYLDENETLVRSSDANIAINHLFNSPPAHIVNYYKSRLYLADYRVNGTRYKNTVLRSSYGLGIVALITDDIPTADLTTLIWTIPVSDTRYLYTDTGQNTLEIYRGPLKVADVVIASIQQYTITATLITFQNGFTGFLAADEVWISGTYTGKKVHRWINNGSVAGRDVKQYDTFKLSGGENEEIKMMATVGNIMLIASNSAMASWNDYVLQNFDIGIGCVSRRGWLKCLGSLYFVHYTGIFATTGSLPKLISSKVKPYIEGATRSGLENSAVGRSGQSIFFAIGDVTLKNPDGSIWKTLNGTCLEYNIIQDNWFIHIGVYADNFQTWIDTLNPDRLMFTDTTKNKAVKEFLSGENDDGDNIISRFDLNTFTLQPEYENFSDPKSVTIEVERGSAVQAFVALDRKPYYELQGMADKGITELPFVGEGPQQTTPPATRLVSVSLRDSSPQISKINRMTLKYIPGTSISESDLDVPQ